ncbi:MAG TPA: hypothetical protein VNY73_07680 [Bacteroidia bacterium]|jgi:hypothetical protein|nr:hypothetical protein [Bacteroidia bacterium]
MKKVITIAFLAATYFAFAQEVKVKEGSESFSNGSHNSLSVDVFVDDLSKVQKEWKSQMKDFGYEKASDKGKDYDFDNVKFKTLSNNPMDVYTRFDEIKDQKSIRVHAAFDMGGDFVSSSKHSAEYEFMKKMMREFSLKTSKEYVEDQFKDANKVLVRFQDKQKDLEKDNKGLDNDIKNYKDKIKKAEDDIEKNKKDIEAKKKEIELQQKVVDGIKSKLESIK